MEEFSSHDRRAGQTKQLILRINNQSKSYTRPWNVGLVCNTVARQRSDFLGLICLWKICNIGALVERKCRTEECASCSERVGETRRLVPGLENQPHDRVVHNPKINRDGLIHRGMRLSGWRAWHVPMGAVARIKPRFRAKRPRSDARDSDLAP